MNNAINNTRDLLPDHYATLLGERPAGSQWGRDFTVDDFALPWRQATPHPTVASQGCRYYRLDGDAFAAAFPDAVVRAVPYSGLSAGDRQRVCRVDGAHGPELRLDGVGSTRATDAWLIVGQHDGVDVVFTVHPGAPLLPCPAGTPDPALPVAVKLDR